jgi:hypothetical protein
VAGVRFDRGMGGKGAIASIAEVLKSIVQGVKMILTQHWGTETSVAMISARWNSIQRKSWPHPLLGGVPRGRGGFKMAIKSKLLNMEQGFLVPD